MHQFGKALCLRHGIIHIHHMVEMLTNRPTWQVRVLSPTRKQALDIPHNTKMREMIRSSQSGAGDGASVVERRGTGRRRHASFARLPTLF